MRLEAVRTGVAFVAFDLAASTERAGKPVQPQRRRRWQRRHAVNRRTLTNGAASMIYSLEEAQEIVVDVQVVL